MKNIIEIKKRIDELTDKMFNVDEDEERYHEIMLCYQIEIETLEYVLK